MGTRARPAVKDNGGRLIDRQRRLTDVGKGCVSRECNALACVLVCVADID
jgi:hypothetical protein